MSSYDPFVRGPHPVGVRNSTVEDRDRGRALPVEFWYPASDAHRGEDLDPATRDRFRTLPMAPEQSQNAVRDAAPHEDRFPFILFSHGFGGTRLQSTHFCTHLASHGYVVAAMDHVGNTMADMLQAATNRGGAGPHDSGGEMRRFIADRPSDAVFVIDQVLAGAFGDRADADRIGMTGHSFGGWTTLATTARDRRIRAALPLAPAGGRGNPLNRGGDDPLQQSLDLAWSHPVPTLYLVADYDTLLPLESMHDLFERTRAPKQMVVLRNSDHFHFCDGVEQTHDMFKMMGPMLTQASPDGAAAKRIFDSMKPSGELCPGNDAYTYLQGLGLAHMDAYVKDDSRAAELLAGDIDVLLADRGIEVETVRDTASR
jgi:dienelactone hydrolase